jgi:uncharacterized protein
MFATHNPLFVRLGWRDAQGTTDMTYMIRCCAAALYAAALLWGPASAATSFREITWLELVPKDWKPQETLDRKRAESLQDGDALAKQMMQELRRVLDTAPTVSELDGADIRMPGYLVPLEQTRDGLREFLLVPYFGACIHTPPPPANQIVHVVSSKPVPGFQTMAAVWVHGKLKASRRDNGIGVSGYALELSHMEPYQRP